MTDPALQSVVERFGQGKLLVMGDLGLERVLHGETLSSPERTRFRVTSQTTRASGAAAVACAAAALGAKTWVAGLVGQDARSGELLRALSAAGVDPFGAASAPGMATAETLVVEIAGDGGVPFPHITIELAQSPPLEGAAARDMIAHIEALIAQVDALVLVAPESAEPAVVSRAADVARARGKMVIGGQLHGWLPACDVAVIAGSPEPVTADIERLAAENGHRAIIACGNGRIEVHQAGAVVDACPIGREVCGSQAWDYLLAGVAAAAAAGADPTTAARIGAAAATAAAAGLPVTPDALQRELRSQ